MGFDKLGHCYWKVEMDFGYLVDLVAQAGTGDGFVEYQMKMDLICTV